MYILYVDVLHVYMYTVRACVSEKGGCLYYAGIHMVYIYAICETSEICAICETCEAREIIETSET